jgi:hypothetical protein
MASLISVYLITPRSASSGKAGLGPLRLYILKYNIPLSLYLLKYPIPLSLDILKYTILVIMYW